ncbi:MAG TPA: hypothetical protein VNU68_10210 [Verrucomicrobiae bacterium]|nr:hypothetical protein [Verrucomicrobiae bacterium]
MALLDALLLDPSPFEVWIAKRTDGIGGSGTVNDPWDGSTTARLDSILSQLPGNAPMTIHLGPGTFTTKGYTDEPTVTPGWEINKIRGQARCRKVKKAYLLPVDRSIVSRVREEGNLRSCASELQVGTRARAPRFGFE